MTDKNLVILSDAPAAHVAGDGHDFGSVNLDRIRASIDLASGAHKSLQELEATPDDLRALRLDINDLSDALRAIAGELYQVGRGLREGRISVEDPYSS